MTRLFPPSPPPVRESKIVLDSGYHAVDSGSVQVLDFIKQCQVNLNSGIWIP